MEKRAIFISSKVKGETRVAAWEGVREVDLTKDVRSRESSARTGVPRRSLKNLWRMEALAGWEKTGLPSSASKDLI
jgi:hypothetical protein